MNRAEIRRQVRMILIAASIAAGRSETDPSEAEEMEAIAHQTYLLGEALAVWLEAIFEGDPGGRSEAAEEILAALRRRLVLAGAGEGGLCGS